MKLVTRLRSLIGRASQAFLDVFRKQSNIVSMSPSSEAPTCPSTPYQEPVVIPGVTSTITTLIDTRSGKDRMAVELTVKPVWTRAGVHQRIDVAMQPYRTMLNGDPVKVGFNKVLNTENAAASADPAFREFAASVNAALQKLVEAKGL